MSSEQKSGPTSTSYDDQHIIEAGKSTRDTMEETHRMTSANDSSECQYQAISDTRAGKSQKDRLGSGHYDDKQRRLFLGLQIFSISTALVGLALLATWVFKYKKGVSFTGTRTTNLHALLMYTFMVGLNAYGVLIYRTFYSQSKDKLKWAHAILAAINILMALTGVTIMFTSHDYNLYSLHSWIGLSTTSLYVSQFLFGFVAFLRPGLSQSMRERSMPLHRFVGITVLCMAGLAAITGITEWCIWYPEYNQRGPITYLANFTGLSILISTVVSVYLLSQGRYRRPPIEAEPEEPPMAKSPE